MNAPFLRWRWAPAIAAWALLPLTGAAQQKPPLGQGYAPVTADDVRALRLTQYFTPDRQAHEPDFAWSFAKDRFTIEAGKAAVPADLREKVAQGAAARRIVGKWTLERNERGGTSLVLTEVALDDGPADEKLRVALPIFRTAPTVIRVGNPQYVFSRERQPPEPAPAPQP